MAVIPALATLIAAYANAEGERARNAAYAALARAWWEEHKDDPDKSKRHLWRHEADKLCNDNAMRGDYGDRERETD